MQTNVQEGKVVFLASGSLEDREGYLVELVNDSGTAKVAVPGANSDITPYVVTDGGVDGEVTTVEPLQPRKNFRVKAKGTGNPGDVLVGADVATPADAGKVRAVPATPGTYFSPGIAEEAFVDGQLVLVRPMPRVLVVT